MSTRVIPFRKTQENGDFTESFLLKAFLLMFFYYLKLEWDLHLPISRIATNQRAADSYPGAGANSDSLATSGRRG